MTRYILIFVLFVVTSCKTTKLAPDMAIQKLGPNPYFEFDGIPVKQEDIGKYDAKTIASATTYYDRDATKKYGLKARDGAVIFETKAFDKTKYESFFRKISIAYEKTLKDYDGAEIQYILNDRILTDDFEGLLASIDKKLLKDLKIIDQKELLEKYQIRDKKIGVVIRAKAPKNLYNAKKKF